MYDALEDINVFLSYGIAAVCSLCRSGREWDATSWYKKTSHRCGDVTKTQNIDMKSGSPQYAVAGCQHFSIFLRGCKQANLSTFVLQRYGLVSYLQNIFQGAFSVRHQSSAH